MAPAIVVDNVWKQYLIGRARYSSLRDTLVSGWRRMWGRPAQSETERTREFDALKGVSFEVEQGTTLGIIGPNGAGKSTLLKLISRVTIPTKGTITTHGRVSALIEVGAGFHPELTGRENVFLNGSILGMTRKEVKSKLDAIVDFSGLEEFIDTPVKYYSSGMYVRLGFSVAAHTDPEILLVDEILSVGDEQFRRKSLNHMKGLMQSGATVVLVSHSMVAINALCDRVVWVAEGKLHRTGAAQEICASYLEEAGGDPHVYDIATSTERERDGSGEVVFRRAWLEQNGTRVTTIQSDQPVRLCLKIDRRSSVQEYMVGFRVIDAAGVTLVYATSGKELGEKAAQAPERVVQCEIPPLPLKPGRYAIETFLCDMEQIYAYDRIKDAIYFDVQGEVSASERLVAPAKRCRVFGSFKLVCEWSAS